ASTPSGTGMAGAMSSAMSSAGSSAPVAASSALPAKSIKLAMKPDAKPGSDGKTHDALVPSAEITVKAGQTVRLTILNYDDMPHSFTSPGLARGAAIPPAFAADAGDRAGPEGDAGARPRRRPDDRRRLGQAPLRDRGQL